MQVEIRYLDNPNPGLILETRGIKNYGGARWQRNTRRSTVYHTMFSRLPDHGIFINFHIIFHHLLKDVY